MSRKNAPGQTIQCNAPGVPEGVVTGTPQARNCQIR